MSLPTSHTPPLAPALRAAAERMQKAISATVAERSGHWSDLVFSDHAVEIFRAQYEHVGPYRAWCDYVFAHEGRDLEDVRRWQDVPALPISAFKQLRVAGHAPEHDRAVWCSSGTTQSTTSRHALPDLGLYELSLLAGARAALAPDEGLQGRLVGVQLAPTGGELHDSSLSHMLDLVRHELCAEGEVFADADSIDTEGAWRRLERAAADGQPVLMLTTSFALVHLLDTMADREALQLAPGSRLMDTGGYKGRSRELERDQLLQLVGDRLGLAPEWCENEYGMSELSTQAYLGTIAQQVGRPLPGLASANGQRRWQPAWMRTRVVDAVTLEQVADGDTGLLVHYDLANVWSCAAVRSEDLGRRIGASYEILGRAPGAELRGCSLRLEEIL